MILEANQPRQPAPGALAARWASPARRGCARRSPRHIRRSCFVALITAALFSLSVPAAESTYYKRFNEALSEGQAGFMQGADLVNTNNLGPTLTNAPISYNKFSEGELGGIRLGMTMLEVAQAWGKPRACYSRCAIGPRFWYVPARYFGDVSLSFVGDRLVLIALSGETAKSIVFDNGLSGAGGRSDYERTLGQPHHRDTHDLALYNGEIAYRRGLLRISFQFHQDEPSKAGREHLEWAAVCFEAEAASPRREQNGPAKRGQPVGSETNRPSAAVGPGG